MYRLLSASKDTYIQNKYIAGSRSTTSNVGQAGTLDLFKLYNEIFISTTASMAEVTELSRLLIKFDLSPLQNLTSSVLNFTSPSFSCFLSLRDVYGGQITPSNFTVRLAPLSKSWDEGRGSDVVAFRDLDSSNFITASVAGGTPSLWAVSGAAASGSIGDTVDIMVSGNLGSGVVDLTTTQLFARGDEDLYMNVTTLVSATLAGIIPNNGWRLSFVDSEETDTTTRFVKRFGSRHTLNKDLHPKLVVKYNDQIVDRSSQPLFGISQDIFVYNYGQNGNLQNFTSASNSISGDNSLMLQLIASHSVVYTTSSFSVSHNATIGHLTRSLSVITQSFSGSQFKINSFVQSGIYSASVLLDPDTNQTLSNFLSGSSEHKFQYKWTSLDGAVTFAQGYTTFKRPFGSTSNLLEHNWVTNLTNMKQVYSSNEQARMRVFIQDYNTEVTATRVPVPAKPVVLDNVQWRLLKAFSRDVVIPFDSVGTLCSVDGEGMYFDLWMQDLDPGEVYEVELLIVENGKDYHITNAGFRFKVSP